MSILVIRTGGLGDCLVTLPVIRQIKRFHDSEPIEVLGNGMMCEVAGLAGWIDICHDVDDYRFVRLFTKSPLTDELATFFSCYSHVYCFSSTAAPEVLAGRIRDAGTGTCIVHDPRPPDTYREHIVSHLIRILPDEIAELPDLKTSLPHLFMEFPRTGRHGLIIHPGSGSMAKNWPLERFCTVADQWEGPVNFIIGPAEVERGYDELLAGHGFDSVLPASIHALAECIADASLFLGNDSGTAHLAGMLRIPSIVLFGPTDPVRWKPLGGMSMALRSSDTTVQGISVEQVAEALTGLSGYHA